MINKFNISNILSIIAIVLTVISTLLIVGRCHYEKKTDNISCELIYISLLIAIIWSIYGFIKNEQHVLIGYIVIILLLIYLLYLYYKFI
jgi:hypothetical protein